MFVIRQAQLRQLARPGLIEFIGQLRKFIEVEYPEEVILEDRIQVHHRLTSLVNKAYSYGFVLEQQVALFVFFCMELGDDFDQQSIYKSLTVLLTDQKVPAQERIDRVGREIFS